MKTKATVILAAAMMMLGSTIYADGISSQLYLVGYNNFATGGSEVLEQHLYVAQGTGLVGSWMKNNIAEGMIAVSNGTVRTQAIGPDISPFYDTYNGSSYTTAGTYTGTILNSTTYGGMDENSTLFCDGATDGTYNYAINVIDSSVYRFDTGWGSREYLFGLPAGDVSMGAGITYDPTTHSLWMSDWMGGGLVNVAMDGSLLSSCFVEPIVATNFLAMDYSDGTLWTQDVGNGNWTMYHLSTTGQVLESFDIDGQSSQLIFMGGEFEIPEPATMALLGIGAMALLRKRKA